MRSGGKQNLNSASLTVFQGTLGSLQCPRFTFPESQTPAFSFLFYPEVLFYPSSKVLTEQKAVLGCQQIYQQQPEDRQAETKFLPLFLTPYTKKDIEREILTPE